MELSRTQKPYVCEILEVQWSPSVTRYYAGSEYDSLAPYTDLKSHGITPVEARIIYPDQENDPFSRFEIQPDLRTQQISFTFDDLGREADGSKRQTPDKEITKKFDDYGTSRCKIHYYYPQVDLLIADVWYGELQKPNFFGYSRVTVTASNGWRTREATIPKVIRPGQCPHQFGGEYTTLRQLETAGCRYDRHLGGSRGLLNPATSQPFTSCPRLSVADCTARWGHGLVYGGWSLNVPGYVSDGRSGNVSQTTKGLESLLVRPKRVIAGIMHVPACPILLFSRLPNSNNPEQGFVQIVAEIGEGPVYPITNITLNDRAPNANQWVLRGGEFMQPPIGYPGLAENFSLTSMFRMIINIGNPASVTAESLNAECDVVGNYEIAVYTAPSTYTRRWTDDRVWWIFACYENQRWGLGTEPDEFHVDKYITASTWGRKSVTFSHTDPETGVVKSFPHRRTSFNAILESQAAATQIADICRSGRLSVPFQWEGKYSIEPFRAFTEDELTDAPVFTDVGPNRNIVWVEGKEPSIAFTSIPEDQITNEIQLVFNEASNKGKDRPITVDDPNLKAVAGKARGTSFHANKKEYRGFGCNSLNESLKLAYSLLWYGEFDEGGIKNNLRGVLKVPLEYVWNLVRYQAIKLETQLLDDRLTPEANAWTHFRLLYINKIEHGMAELTVQGYNQEAMEAFEVESEDPPPNPVCSIDADCPTGFVCRNGVCVPIGPHEPPGCLPTLSGITFDETTGLLDVPPIDC